MVISIKTFQLHPQDRGLKLIEAAVQAHLDVLIARSLSQIANLARALSRHLEEFPSAVNGLSRSEREALTAVQEGHTTPIAAFLEVAKKQESIFLGDLVFYSYLERLSGNDHPLVTLKTGSPVVAPSLTISREFVESELTLTPLGREVLAGKKDWQTINKKSRWLGGVEIGPGKNGWRWDPRQRRLTNSSLAKSRSKVKKKRAAKAGAKTSRPTARRHPAASGLKARKRARKKK